MDVHLIQGNYSVWGFREGSVKGFRSVTLYLCSPGYPPEFLLLVGWGSLDTFCLRRVRFGYFWEPIPFLLPGNPGRASRVRPSTFPENLNDSFESGSEV